MYKNLKILYKNISSNLQNIFTTVYRNHVYISDANVVTHLHQKTFGKYRNCNEGKDVILFAPGPSLNIFKPINNTINIGVNRTLLCDKIKLDYFFAIDYYAVKDYLEKVTEFPDLKIFYGSLFRSIYTLQELKSTVGYVIPESVINRHRAGKFFVYPKWPAKNYNLSPDIDLTWFGNGYSCIFPAFQFALFTNPKRIYLVGCDSTIGYFNEKTDKEPKKNELLYKLWKEMKEFADVYYPETEIISVNPVGLKGLFKDLYQE